MTEISLYGGPLKSTIIQRAYGLLGLSTVEYTLSPEEYVLGLQCCNAVAGMFSASLGFNLPEHGDGYSEDESGLSSDDVLGFTTMVAQELGPNIGKSFAANANQKLAVSRLFSKYQAVPTRELGRQTVRGAGNRLYNYIPFFIAPVSDEEPVQ